MIVCKSSKLNQLLKVNQPLFWLLVLLVVSAVIWTLLATIFKPFNPDALEAYRWSRSFELGYTKNPYLIGWIFHFSFGSSKAIWGYYATQYLLMCPAVIGLYKLMASVLDDKKTALMGVFLLCSITGYLDINRYWNNDNFMLLLFWPWLLLSYFKALEQPKYWLLTAVLAGLALMGKYSTVVFFPVMLLYLFKLEYRHHFKSIYLYLGIVIFLIMTLPNLFWLYHNDFVAFKWALRQGVPDSVASRIGTVFGVFYPIILSYPILYFFGVRFSWRDQLSDNIKRYLWIGALPIACFVLGLTTLDSQVHGEWLIPFGFFSVLLMLCFFQVKSETVKIRKIIIFAFVMLAIKAAIFTWVNWH